jgi:xylulokinase
MEPQPQILTVDVGTGSVRAALVGLDGRARALQSVAHATRQPRHGWSEQAPQDWWAGARAAIAATLAQAGSAGIAAICCCGQMHAPVLLDRNHRLVQDGVPLWNDKRSAELAADFGRQPPQGRLPAQVNPPTSAWPGMKLAWMARHDRAVLDRARWLLMPKDWLNLCLCGETAMDWTEAGSSFLSDPGERRWSPELAAALGVDPAILPPILPAAGILGRVTPRAAAETGLPAGLPVIVGGGDFPVAILGSGVTAPGQVSDITGTSFLLTCLARQPITGPQIMNVATAGSGWGAFAVVDAAGDAIRWASRTLDRSLRSYEALSDEAAAAPAGAEGLIFLPYLTGERLGQGPASRGAFLGLTARHGPGHLHRAIMEGIVLAMHEAYAPIAAVAGAPGEIIAAAGGARSAVLLAIKANVFGCPVRTTAEPEAGLVGTACLAFAGLGHFSTPAEAATALVGYRAPVLPRADLQRVYHDLAGAFSTIRGVMPAINASFGTGR